MNGRLTTPNAETEKPTFGSKARKPFRQSGLRKAFNAGHAEQSKDQDDEDDGPAVVRPNISRNSSTQKKKTVKSKLSFGGDTGEEGDGEESEPKTKKAPLGKRALENSAARRGIAAGGLPFRSVQDEDDRPKYSKEYLKELQSSTPNTPRDVPANISDEMELDSSELEGAMIVDSPSMQLPKSETKVLSEAEVREKKERRARLAKEQDFLSLEDDEEETSLSSKKKDDTRLKAEDENLGEGFDDYVEDGGLSLGKRAEKERKRHDRKQMAELISAAEGHSSSESSDEEAERRMAYEAAQTRAGMDGLKKPRKDPAEEMLKVPPKITPLPNLSECVQKLQASLRAMETEINSKNARVQQLHSEKMEISKREAEVQALLDETGKRYQEAMGTGKIENGTLKSSGPGAEFIGERGLDSLGTTPRRADEEDL